MKKLTKIFLIILALIVLVILALVGYVAWFLPNIPVRDVKAEATQQNIERGRYLANHVAVCIDCHSKRDWNKFTGPIVPGTEGIGGEKFSKDLGFPGTYYAPNISPYNLGKWSDGEIFRAITSGVNKESKALFPIMPYLAYGTLDEEDILSIIAYIRTLPSVTSENPASESDFPMSLIINTIPQKPAFTKRPEKGVTADYGKYIATAASCIECHTPFVKGKLVAEEAFSGGREFMVPGGLLVSANITPDKTTGIGTWTKEAFIARFKAYDLATYTPQEVIKGDLLTLMPWTMFAGMDTTDLQAVYAYLQTVKPVQKQITKFTPAK